jgi:chemotaxis regulatin CheY-phosphate phosphatase CheZ
MFLVFSAELSIQIILWVSGEVVLGQDPRLLTGQGHLVVELIDALLVEVAFGHVYEALSSDQAEHQSVDDTYSVVHKEERHTTYKDGVFDLLGTLGLLLPLTTLHDWHLILHQVVINLFETL